MPLSPQPRRPHSSPHFTAGLLPFASHGSSSAAFPTQLDSSGPTTPVMSPRRGFLHGAGNFIVNDTRLVDDMNIYFDYGTPVLRLLFESSIQGTELDSSARYPPPRCYPGTRQSIIRGITDWMKNPKRAWNILWLYGFAGVGKTAIAQTVAEAAKEAHILGAAFFFSPTHKNDPVRLFVSIAYQLAASNGQYRRAVAIQLANDPGLLQKDMRTQFKKLLIEPLSQLELEKKLLIVIDGLDECHGYDEQCEIILLISKAASSPVSLPVIWMIGSRPEYHIKSTFYNADSEIDCWRKDVVVNDSETRRDIEVFIRSRFSEIMKRYSIIPKGGESWPTAGDLEKIINAVSGLFFYAATIVEFVADPYFGGPEDQLSFVISFIEDCSAKVATVNPLYYLDRLYEQILSGVPPALIHRMLQLLGIVAFYPSLPILQLANLFGYTQNRFSSITRRLYSVADIPHPDKASQDALHFFHSSFVDFLRNPARSGRFAINDRLVHLEFAKASFGVLGQATPRFAMNLAWTPAPGDISAFSVARQILYYCAANVWGACLELEDIDDPILLNMLVNFRYPFLRFVKDKIPISPFRDWIEWLTRQIQRNNLQNIIQPVELAEEDCWGSIIPADLAKGSFRAFNLGAESKCITVLLRSDVLIFDYPVSL